MGLEALPALPRKEVVYVIEVKNLVKRYGNHNAVDHLSFTVEDGQIFGFLGPNGAGKSTAMNIMTGYLAATEGDVVIEGHNVLEEPEAAKKCIGYLPELPPLYPDMTVLEYLRFVAELKKLPKEERENQIGKAVALTHLEDMAHRLIKNLSKGYRQRVGLAQAILGFPKIIILDEPTVGLDPKQVVEIRDLIRHLAKEHTVLISSHILSEVRAVCDHVLIIRKGKFVACDTPENLEEMLSTNDQMELLVQGTQETAEKILMQVSGIQSHTVTEHTDDTVRMILSTEGDLRETLFFAFAKADCALLEMKPRMASLEDVFLDLTDDDDTVAAAAAKFLNQDEAAAGALEAAPEAAVSENAPAAVEEKEAKSDESNL